MIITKEDIKKEEINPEDIWAKMVDFGKYGFNKSHSVSYSIISYWTSWLWVNHRDEFLTFELNYDTKKRFQQAIDKCLQLGMKFEYPTINSMIGNEYLVRNNSVYIPGGAKRNYNSYVDFLFDDENGEAVTKLIYMGVCDKLTKDRFALATLATTLLAKPKKQALFMEPEGTNFKKLSQILEGLKMAGAVVDYKKINDPNEGFGTKVWIKRGRGNPSEVFFHEDNSDFCKANIVQYDLKEFGSIRYGTLSDLPYINTNAIERTLENLKERYIQRHMEDKIYYAMKDKLDEYMRTYFNTDYRKKFEDVYAVIDDISVFDRSIKLVLNFNDRQGEILYCTGRDLMKKVRTFSKKSLVKMTLIYSPFIQRRTQKFIYDFDIQDIDEIKTK